MWVEWFVPWCWFWQNDERNEFITIVNRRDWEVVLNNEPKTSRATYEEAKVVVDRYMSEHP